MAKKMPKEIYVQWKEYENDEPSLSCDLDPIDTLDSQYDVKRRVAVFKFSHYVTVEQAITVKKS